ncbi:MAG: hypothetical protein UMR38_03225 [Candidatus Izemoplasma sp.]|nr:hypothetical protein [Candidatus Izemoplasma sp.]
MIQSITHSDKADIIALWLTNYKQEKAHVSSLPEGDDLVSSLEQKIQMLLDHHQGILIRENGQLLGYMFYILGDELFGNQKCAFVPLFGHASIASKTATMYQTMLNHVSKTWIHHKRLSWVVRIFEHNHILTDFWFKNDFGQRCSDGIRPLTPLTPKPTTITIKKASKETYLDMLTLEDSHQSYYPEAPLCMPVSKGDIRSELDEWFYTDNHHLWIAYDHKTPVGYIKIEPHGESFISHVSTMMNVT